MAALLGFRSRSPDRDRRTDEDRLRRLRAVLDQIAGEIAAERGGLSKRLQARAVNAGFLNESIENGEMPAKAVAKLDDLSSSIVTAERRLALLARQSIIVESWKKNLNEFPE
jgi:hypothetical protein